MSSIKKILLCSVLLFSSSAVRPASALLSLGVMYLGSSVKTGVAFLIGTYCLQKAAKCGAYMYYAKGARKQKKNPNICYDKVELFKKICNKNGVTIDHVFYDPKLHHRGNAAVLSSFMGNILIIGSGYGLSKHEDVEPLTYNQILFILGHECNHIKHDDMFYREVLTTLTLTAEWSVYRSMISRYIFTSSWDLYCSSLWIAYAGHAIRMALSRFQEYNADYYASDDPEVIKAGIEFWQKDLEQEQYGYVLSEYDPKKDITDLFDSHGCAASRIQCLENRLEEVTSKQETIWKRAESQVTSITGSPVIFA